ncbi:MAG: helix-turn-helix domain-containing protein [Herpetosiphonaceae bacterium]|nr:helix-turn-helix domain-containing protein [Herpetosiphonaceae bacterium]
MTRRQHNPLRPLTAEERVVLEQISRSRSEPTAHVERAKLILAVASGLSYTAAAQTIGRRSNDAVAHLVTRFNVEGLSALEPRHGGGSPPVYGPQERERILAEVRRTPEAGPDGTVTWSLTLLQRALRTAPDGLPTVSTYTIWRTLHDAGLRWQRDQAWCATGTAVRVRKQGTVIVTDPDSTAKKT